MKANELMVGDWVQNPLGAKGWVKEIRLIPKDSDGFGGYYLVDIAYSKDGDSYARLEAKELNPIPLTPEILEKYGFESCKEGYDIGIPLLYWDKYCTAVCGWTHCSNIIEVFDCRYVHQLQHALRLCGIDKEIELI